MTDPATGATHEQQTLPADDGQLISVNLWRPLAAPRGLVQVVHGLSEHAARYERFAAACTARNLAVVAHDHRGHGVACPAEALGHFADDAGWDKVIADVRVVNAAVRKEFADLPLAMLSHSMGSYIAQSFVMRHPGAVGALVLSGSTYAPRLQLRLGQFAAWLECKRHGKRHRSPLLNKQAFGAFNQRFEPARTAFDWLSRDTREVDRYLADRHCGAVPSAQLWLDLIGGLLEIGTARALRSVPADLPVLITGGGNDPVGGRRGMARLAARWAHTGHENVTLNVFDDARHEMLNETNRDEFTRFVIDWIDQSTA